MTRFFLGLTVLAVVMLLVPGGPALADTNVYLKPIVDTVMPYVTELISAIIIVFVTWLTSWVRAKLKLSIDKTMSDRLQTGLNNAAGILIQRYGPQLANTKLDVKDERVADVINYLITTIPDVLAHFKIDSPEGLALRVEGKLGQLTATNTAVNPSPEG